MRRNLLPFKEKSIVFLSSSNKQVSYANDEVFGIYGLAISDLIVRILEEVDLIKNIVRILEEVDAVDIFLMLCYICYSVF